MTPRTGSLALAAEWLLALAILTPLALMPLARDQGHFAYTGQVILDGGVPYRDVFDQKGPATHYTFALALAIFGQSTFAVRIFFLIVTMLATRLVASLAERLAGSAARLPCVGCFALAMLQGDSRAPWHTAQVEDLLLVGQLAALWLIGSQAALQTRWRVLLAGVVLGLSCVYKPTAVLPSAALGLTCMVWFMARGADRAVSPWRWLTWAVSGFAVAPAVALGFLAAQGALGDFWSVLVEFNSVYAGRRGGPITAVSMLTGRWGRLMVLAAFGAVAARRREGSLLERMLWILLLANWAAVASQGKYWAYHWTPMIGLMTIFAGVSVSALVASAGQKWAAANQGPGRRLASRIATGLVAVCIALVAVPMDLKFTLGLWRDTARVATRRITVDEFRAPYACGAVTAEVHRQMADYVRQRTEPGDTLLVWGYETVVNFLADRRAPSRFAVDRILCLDEFARLPEWREEFLESLRISPPEYILVVRDDSTGIWRDSDEELRRFVGLRQFVEQQYAEETRIDRFQVYRRSPAPADQRIAKIAARGSTQGARR